MKRKTSRTWTDEELEALRVHIASGGSAIRASVRFGRTLGSVQELARKLGTPFPTIREVRKRYLATEAKNGTSSP
jgi:hypothetical protein